MQSGPVICFGWLCSREGSITAISGMTGRRNGRPDGIQQSFESLVAAASGGDADSRLDRPDDQRLGCPDKIS